eukprot:SAG31_NODE_138_length_22877_cov_29.540917_23_plen_628_part_00
MTLRSPAVLLPCQASIGKDHFGWNATRDLPPLDPQTDSGDKGSGTPHGYQRMSLYDGLTGQQDDYHQWFLRQAAQSKGGTKPGDVAEKGWPTLNMNGWMGAPFVFAEYLHPTAWVGQQAVDWLTKEASSLIPWFLKISFHRPHSPYDPPARVLNATTEEMLPTVQIAKDGWDKVFVGGAAAPPGCGPKDLSAWCGLMPTDEQQLGRRSYYANVAFIDEWVGKIMDALAQTKFDPFIIWTADHGDGQADHYHWRKGFPYQFSANVPFTFVWPESYPAVTPRGTVDTKLVVELRDVLPTMLDAAGALHTVPAGHKIDGTSMLCLLKDKTGGACKWTGTGKGSNATGGSGWRPYLDLEHTTCYNNSNHWSALTDGRMKYIFNACENCDFPPKEQLFNLTADPGELVGLHDNPAYAQELAKWRQRMVVQFEQEGRGDVWVKHGALQLRPTITYGPNFPGHFSHHGGHMYTCENISVSAGDKINLETNQGTMNIKFCQDIHVANNQMHLIVAPELCIVVDHTSLADEPALALANCSSAAAKGCIWEVPGVDRAAAHVIHKPSGLCLTGSAAGTATIATCEEHQSFEPEAPEQLWVLGASGRLCVNSGCLSVIAGQSMMSKPLEFRMRSKFLR